MKMNEVLESSETITPPLSALLNADNKMCYDDIGHGFDRVL